MIKKYRKLRLIYNGSHLRCLMIITSFVIIFSNTTLLIPLGDMYLTETSVYFTPDYV